MEILQYHPTIAAYAACDRKNGTTYLDLSEDVTSCSVTRESDAPSKFTLHLENPSGKYDQAFLPLDRIKIYAGKDSPANPLIAGYISSAPQFRLFNHEIVLSGMDTLYRLQRLYFDPGLTATKEAMGYGGSHPDWDYGDLVISILENIANWPKDQISVAADIPESFLTFARNLYSKQREDIKIVGQLREQFGELLRSTGPTFAGSGYASGVDLNATLGAGQTIQLPAGLGTAYTITTYSSAGFGNGVPSAGTMQRVVWNAWKAHGCQYKNYIAVLNDRYLVACTPTFGRVGDYVSFKLANGQVISGIIADEKNMSDPGCTKWGHDNGASVVEFEADPSWWRRYRNNPGTSGWMPEWGGTTCVSGTNYGPAINQG